MFNSIVLEVAIGIVLIYFLYSLLTTIINELLASIINLRGIILKHAIGKLLTDDSQESKNPPKRLLEKFEEQPAIKKMISGCFGNRYPSYIPDKIFSSATLSAIAELGDGMINAVSIAASLNNNKETGNSNNKSESATTKLFVTMLKEADNDIDKFKKEIEVYFNAFMDRASGWYKRWTQLTIFLIGLLLAIVFNVDTFKIVETLSNDKDARAQLIAIADTYAKSKPYLPAVDSTKIDTLLSKASQLVQNDISKTNTILGQGWPEDYFKKTGLQKYGPKKFDYGKFFLALLGWLITALAISFGAPFWFDLLTKFINLRGAGDLPKNPPANGSARSSFPEKQGQNNL